LNINFHFIPVVKKTQDKLNEEAAQTIFKIAAPEFTDWLALLKRPAPTEKNKERTLLEKHLNEYTSRNTFDYFVHKDLGGFLNRELNFFIKNEVFHLDDLAESSFKLTETQLAKAKVIKLIVSKIIRMLAQIEDFQKKIWLKKKFIIEKNYCIPLSRLPDNIIDLCLKNNLQIDEWKNLGFTSENNDISLELNKIGNLLVDTKNFSRNDKLKILSNVNNLDEILQGEVIHGENFSALNLLSEKYRASVQTICIDPPYNIGGDDFLYKDKFKHSSWISMMRDRIALGRALLKNSGVFYSNIDDKERLSLELTLDNVFGNNNKIEELIWMQNTTNNQAPMYSTNHEYIQCYAIDKSSVANVEWMFRDKKPGAEEVLTLISKLNPSFPSIDEIENKINDLYSSHRREIETELNSAGLEYDKKLDPWKSIYLYSNAEYRTDDGRYVNESDAQKYNAKIWLWGSDNPSRPASKQAAETKNPNHPSFCFYKPKHPTTGELCPHPNRGWAWPARPVEGLKGSFEEMNNDHRIAWGKDHTTIPRKKIFIHEAASQVSQSIIADYTDGEKELAHLFGRNQVFPNPKPSSLIEKLINQSSGENSIICDFFAGSGTTGQAVLTSEVYRKYILVEQGEHFYDVLMPRLKKLYFSEVWKDGKPDVNIDKKKTQSTRKGFSYAVIESYEDSLSNLNISKNNYSDLLEENKSLKEDYYLNYFLSYDTKNSQSLFNIESFNEFDSYKMNFSPASSSVKKPTDIDIIETFNYLIGIKLDSIQNYGSTIVLNGHLRNNESCIVIWRKIDELPNEKLGQFLHKLSISPLDTEFSYIYINGDHTLEDPFSKVRMIEAEFKRLMFDVQDV
jgi:adenine-specific DNA-methyltransferase